MRPTIDGSTILVTGASSGIGRELARQLGGRARARSALMVDICAPHGIWLDDGELRRVVELVAAGKLPEPPREPERREPEPPRLAGLLSSTPPSRASWLVRLIEWLLEGAPYW